MSEYDELKAHLRCEACDCSVAIAAADAIEALEAKVAALERERDALRAEVERMRAKAEALEKLEAWLSGGSLRDALFEGPRFVVLSDGRNAETVGFASSLPTLADCVRKAIEEAERE